METGSQRGLRLYLVTGGVLTLLYFAVPPFRANGFVFNLVGVCSAIAIVAGARKRRPSERLLWYLLAAGQIAFVLGDAVYYGYATINHTEVPFPSLGDVFYLATYPFLIAGLVLLVGRRNPGRDRASLLDALIISTGVGLLAWVFLMVPYARDASLSGVEKVVSIAYPLMDVLLAAVTVRLVVDRGNRPPAFYLLAGGLAFLTLTDIIYGLVELKGSYQQGSLLDLGWIAYYLLWGAAALHPSMGGLLEPGAARPGPLSRRRLLLLSAASLMAPAVEVARAGETREVLVMAGGSALLFLFVVARMAGIIREQERATRRERALRKAGTALVAARDRPAVFEASCRALQTLAGRDCLIRLCVPQEAGATSVIGASAGRVLVLTDLPEDVLRDVAIAGEREQAEGEPGGRVEPSRLPDELQERLKQQLAVQEDDGHGPSGSLAFSPKGHVLAMPIILRGEPWGLIVVAQSTDRNWEELDAALETLTSQMVLALEGLVLVEERRRSEARFRSLVQSSSDLTMVCNAEGVLTYVSPASRRILGFDDASLTGRPVADLLFAGDCEDLGTRVTERAGRAGAGGVLECRVRHADGSSRRAEITVTNLLEDPGVRGIVLNLRDVTDRHRLETELRHAQKLESVGQLAAGIAHEINTPIQFVGDNVRFLRDAFGDLTRALDAQAGAHDPPGPGTQVHRLDEVEAAFLVEEVPIAIDQTLEGVERISTIVQAMKAFGHPSSATKAPADLNQAVRNTLVVANNEIRHVADVVTELGELPPVWCHLGDLNQVLLNLIVNAAHAVGEAVGQTGGRGTITVRTAADGEDVVIEVADTGIGIAPAIADRIFEPFFTTKEIGKGTGQGLTLAYSLIHDGHNGTITFRSEPGSGTTFAVRIPVGPDRQPAEGALP